MEELETQFKVKVEGGVPGSIEKRRRQQGLLGDFEERLMCVHVLIRRRALLLDIETDLFEKPIHKAIASGNAPGPASRAGAAPRAEVETRGSASRASVASREKIRPTQKKIQPTSASEVFMAVKTEGADAKMTDVNAEEEAKREGSRAAVTATKKLDRIDKEREELMKPLVELKIEERSSKVRPVYPQEKAREVQGTVILKDFCVGVLEMAVSMTSSHDDVGQNDF